MLHREVVKKIETLPESLLREVEDFVDFLLLRYSPEGKSPEDEYPAGLLSRLNEAGGSFDWLNDPAEDIYSDEDGVAV